MIIRQETKEDHIITEDVIKKAFKNAEHSDHDEHLLVQRLRKSNAFIPELSILAELKNKIAGHILFTRITISGKNEIESIALAPVSVLPEHQKKGIGGKLIQEGLKKATELGFKSVIVLGHKDYYPKFGFEKASKWNIKCPFEVPDEVFMAIELKKGSLRGKSGTVKYSKEFGIDNKEEICLIAPCGMNCGICLAFLRNKNKCYGCWGDDKYKSKSCLQCIIKKCELLAKTNSKFCYECEKYPCLRLKQLDKRYRTKYHMSMLENLENIKMMGLEKFIQNEHERWLCNECGGSICVHRGVCLTCKEK